MLHYDAERILTENGYEISTHYNERHKSWSAWLIATNGKYDLQTPTATGISKETAIVNLFCYWTGYSKIREFKNA